MSFFARSAAISLFPDDRFPGAIDAAFYRLVSGTIFGVGFQRSLNLVTAARRTSEPISQSDLGDLQHALHFLDVAFDISHQVTRRLDLPHVQCGSQGAGQSPGNTSDDVVERGGVFWPRNFPAIFVLIEVLDPAMNAEMERFFEVLNVGSAMRSFVLLNANTACVGDGHGNLSICWSWGGLKLFSALAFDGQLRQEANS